MSQTLSTLHETSNRRVLVVDDDEDFACSLVDVLEPEGFRTDLARGGREAAAIVRHHDIDVAVVDVRLGDVNGVDLIRELREIRPDLICVIMTAYGDIDTAVGALREGVHDFLSKPLDINALLASLGSCFERIRLQREKRAALEALRNSEIRSRAILESTADAIVATNDEGVIELSNSAAASMFGVRRDNLIGRSIADLLVGGEGEKPWEPREVTDCEAVGARASGKHFPAEVSIRPMRLSGSTCHVWLVHDLTERRAREREKAVLEERVRRTDRLESLGRLAGGVAHDFNNMLTALNASAEIVRQAIGEENVSTALSELHAIEGVSHRATALTRQLLTFGHREVLQPECLDVNEVLLGTRVMFERILREGIELVLAPRAERSVIQADVRHIEQVILNLVINADQAIPLSGRITVDTFNVDVTQKVAAPHPGVSAGVHVAIRVRDNGVGMSADTLEHIFEPFFTTKEVGSGTGLGLATVHGIATQWSGFVHVESTEGQGSSFTVFLPANREEGIRPERMPARTRDELLRGGERVLLCEDDDAVRRLTSHILERAGYDVLTTASPDEALEVARGSGGSIQLLLTDVVMPTMSGFALAKELRKTDEGLRVLYVSGYSTEVVASRGQLEIGTHLLEKPFTASGLLERLREILDAKD